MTNEARWARIEAEIEEAEKDYQWRSSQPIWIEVDFGYGNWDSGLLPQELSRRVKGIRYDMRDTHHMQRFTASKHALQIDGERHIVRWSAGPSCTCQRRWWQRFSDCNHIKVAKAIRAYDIKLKEIKTLRMISAG